MFSAMTLISRIPSHGKEIDKDEKVCVHGGSEDENNHNLPVEIKLLPMTGKEPQRSFGSQFYSDTIDHLESRLVLHRKFGTGLQSSSDGEGGLISVLYNIMDDIHDVNDINPIHMYWSYHTSMLLPREFVRTDEIHIDNSFSDTRGYRINETGDTCYVRLIRVPSHGFTIFYDDISADNVAICDSVLNNIQLSEIKSR